MESLPGYITLRLTKEEAVILINNLLDDQSSGFYVQALPSSHHINNYRVIMLHPQTVKKMLMKQIVDEAA